MLTQLAITAAKPQDDARRTIAEGKDPAQKRREEKLAGALAAKNTFGVVAEEYLAKLKDEGAAQSTLDKNVWLLLDLAAPIYKRPVSELMPAEILDLLKRIEKSGRRDTARRLRGVIGTVCRYAVVTPHGRRTTRRMLCAGRSSSLTCAVWRCLRRARSGPLHGRALNICS